MNDAIKRVLDNINPLTVDDSTEFLKSVYQQEKSELLETLKTSTLSEVDRFSIKHRLVQVEEFLFDLMSPHRMVLTTQTYLTTKPENNPFLSISTK